MNVANHCTDDVFVLSIGCISVDTNDVNMTKSS